MTDAGRSKQESAAVAHPLLETRSSTAAGAYELTGRWSTESHWVLDDHRTGTRDAVLPGTGYIELLRAVIASIERGEQMEIQDLYFFRPLHVPDGEIKRIRITVKPDERGYEVVISSARELENGAVGWERHAQAKVSKVSIVAPAALDLAAIDRACQSLRFPEDARGIRTGQEDHLNFGARWRVLRSANFGNQQALARLELPERFAHDLDGYKLHPALLDLATGFAMELIPGYDRKALWVPVSYESVQVYRALPARIWSWVRRTQPAKGGADFTSFDVTITNDAGEPCVVVRNFTIKRLEDSAFAVARAPTRSELDIEAASDGERELSPAQLAFQHSLAQGITPEEGMAALGRVLRSTHGGEVIVSSMDLGKLQKQASATLVETPSDGQKFARPQLESQYVAPRDDIERTLVEFWEELLGVDKVGVGDSFFDLGGHSLVAVRLFAKVKRTYRVDYPISVLFEAPTIAECAAKLREVVGDQPAATNGDGRPQEQKTRYAHLVKMQQGAVGSSRPFFIVAGMFGNVLNLRHLAQLIGTDRSCYGLQARGLYGDHQPHETFEEMASDYLAELRTVQPEGPYLLGGFSGGGIAAYEMARQLIEQGESVSLLAMLDTPLPRHGPLTRGDRLEIRLQDLKREKAQLVLNWARAKIEYRRHLKEREKRLEVQKAGVSHDFHSQVIEAAFYRALARYEIRPLPVPVALFRPALRVYYRLSRDRMLDRDRQPLFHDNGWNGLVTNVQVTEVPGDHDSMVLEPNVRVLAARLREAIQKAEEAEQGAEGDRSAGADVVPLRPVARVG
jgi:thioesterase domain-containing protein